jgi:hypothetical protein
MVDVPLTRLVTLPTLNFSCVADALFFASAMTKIYSQLGMPYVYQFKPSPLGYQYGSRQYAIECSHYFLFVDDGAGAGCDARQKR